MDAHATWDANVLSYKDALHEQVAFLSEFAGRAIQVQQAAELQYYVQVAAEDPELAEGIESFEKALDAGAVGEGSEVKDIRAAVEAAFESAHP